MKRLDAKNTTSRTLAPASGSERISAELVGSVSSDSEAKYEQFFHLCKDLLCFAGTDGFFQQVNPAFIETLGYSEEELLSRPFLDFVHPDDRESTISEIANLNAGRDTVAFTNRYRCHDGRLLWLEWSARPTTGGAILAVARDVTANREAVTALRESEQRFRELAEHIREVFYVFDANGRELLYVSPAFESVWGFPTVEFYADPSARFRAIECSNERSRVEDAWRRSQREDFELEYAIRRPDGKVRWIRDRCYPIVTDGVLTKIVGIAANITARREAEEAARARSAELAHVARLSTMGELASGIAHELNQPLSAISIHAETCRMRLGNQRVESALEDVDAIAAQTERAARVLRRLRAFVRKHEPTTEIVDLEQLIHEVTEFFGFEISSAGVTVDFDLVSGAKVSGDPIQLQQVLLNLLQNAVQSMSGRPTCLLRVSSRREGSFFAVRVEDTGPGMTPEQMSRVFEPFYTSKDEGLGIGMPISQTIAAAHGGKLSVESEVDEGTVFLWTIPAIEEGEAR